MWARISRRLIRFPEFLFLTVPTRTPTNPGLLESFRFAPSPIRRRESSGEKCPEWPPRRPGFAADSSTARRSCAFHRDDNRAWRGSAARPCGWAQSKLLPSRGKSARRNSGREKRLAAPSIPHQTGLGLAERSEDIQ